VLSPAACPARVAALLHTSHGSRERTAGSLCRHACSGARARCARQDADSLGTDGRKTEGAFYLWRADEVAAALGGGPQAALFAARYGVRPEGNCNRSPRRRAATAARALHGGACRSDAAVRCVASHDQATPCRRCAWRACTPLPAAQTAAACANSGATRVSAFVSAL